MELDSVIDPGEGWTLLHQTDGPIDRWIQTRRDAYSLWTIDESTSSEGPRSDWGRPRKTRITMTEVLGENR